MLESVTKKIEKPNGLSVLKAWTFSYSSKKAWHVLSRLAEEGSGAQNSSSIIKVDHLVDKLVQNSMGAIDKTYI